VQPELTCVFGLGGLRSNSVGIVYFECNQS
jgi:hypothetical protein